MSVHQLVASNRHKPCNLCDRKMEEGEPFIQFDSGGPIGRTTRNNLCVKCMSDIVEEYGRKPGRSKRW